MTVSAMRSGDDLEPRFGSLCDDDILAVTVGEQVVVEEGGFEPPAGHLTRVAAKPFLPHVGRAGRLAGLRPFVLPRSFAIGFYRVAEVDH